MITMDKNIYRNTLEEIIVLASGIYRDPNGRAIYDLCAKALNEPLRNCDMYSKEIDAWRAFSKDHGGADASLELYELWLFEPVKETIRKEKTND
jgi:hypothetical protein